MQAPEEMKGVCSALELVTVSLGQWMTAFLVPAANVLPPLLFGSYTDHTPELGSTLSFPPLLFGSY